MRASLHSGAFRVNGSVEKVASRSCRNKSIFAATPNERRAIAADTWCINYGFGIRNDSPPFERFEGFCATYFCHFSTI